MIFQEKPEGFSPKFDVVGCFIEVDGEILFLHRADVKSEGNKWGIPGGKVEPDEDLPSAVMREVWEETSFKPDAEKFTYFKKVFVQYPTFDFTYHIYHVSLPTRPSITVDPKEHVAYKWVTPKEALDMDLIRDEDTCIKLFYSL